LKYITPRNQEDGRRYVHPSQHQHHVTPITAQLYVVTVITNPNRYYMRYKLYQAFSKMVEDAGAILYTVELATRDRHFEVTSPDNPHDVQLRSPSILWHKENLANIGVRHLPADAEYVALIDADVQFARPDWVQETLHQLQIFRVVQMWTNAIDLGPQFQPIASCSSLFFNYQRNQQLLQPVNRRATVQAARPETGALRDAMDAAGADNYPYKGMLHTGYAWAYRRSALSDLGGFGDIGILGSGDRHMAYALIGEVERSFPTGIAQSYKDYWRTWQDRAEEHIKRKVGIVQGALFHYWHGSKQHRRYQDRWKILVEDRFEPTQDLKYDFQGILELNERNIRLRDDVIAYFAVRNEDSTDL
jgi:hypothetical protein